MKMLPDLSEVLELALILKNSNVPEVAKLAEGFLELEAQFGQLSHDYIMQTSELVMLRHHKTFEKLAKTDTNSHEN